MNTTVVGHEALEGVASDTVTTVVGPAPASVPESSFEQTLPSIQQGACVNCGRELTLRVVATEASHRTYQWVPASEPARRGRRCSEASLPAYHWAADATAAVYHISMIAGG